MTDLGERLTVTGIALSVIGAVMIMAGLIVDSLSVGGGGTVSFGGVVVIGPIPIVFGSDKEALLIGIAGAAILMIFALATLYRGRGKDNCQTRDIPT